ncbi:MAG: hypothetical protein M3N05_01150, partial [Pseudomonadota bacterium]|nr:hypothetical protein [Pseudomonadota bacterium]
MTSDSLALRLKPCGPVLDAKAALRAREAGGESLAPAWPALEPVFAAAPYLASLARRWPNKLTGLLE